jgi:hypothetical protein
MTEKKRRRSGTYRPPQQARPVEETPEAAPRRGFLDSVFAPRGGRMVSMPGTMRSLGRGLVTVVSSPWILAVATVGLILLWLGGVVAGFKGPFSLLANGLAIPPISTATLDAIVPPSLAGTSGTGVLLSVLGAFVLRAAIHAAFTGALVEQLEGRPVSGSSFLRGLRAFPVTMAASLAGFMLLNIGSALAPIVGGLALFVQLAVLVAGVYLFAFAPVISVMQHDRALGSIARSVRAARMPGSGNLSFAALYVLMSVVVLFFPKPGNLLGVNPSIGAWLVVFGISFLHLGFQAAFAYRYLCVYDEVPEAAVRQRASR